MRISQPKRNTRPSDIKYIQEETLDNKDFKIKRIKDLTRATIFGNGQRRKVTIKFKTIEGTINELETYVSGLTKNIVCTSCGYKIPIHAILNVKF